MKQSRNIFRAESPARQYERVVRWNQAWPIGTRVAVTLDSGEVQNTVTRSEAWMLSGHTGVVMVEGIAGGYLLSRVQPVQPIRPEAE